MPQKKTTARKAQPRKKSTTRRRSRRQTAGGGGRGWTLVLPIALGAALVLVGGWLLWRHLARTSVAQERLAPPPHYTVRGIDVSHHQGTINWELLRNQATLDGHPLAFAFIKATEGTDMVDPQFRRNFAAARQYGILRGAYHFYRATVPAKRQAEHFISHVQLQAGDLPPVLDVEMKPQDVSAEAFRQGILEWLVRVEQHYGLRPILYTYHSFRQQYMNDSVFNLYPYWIAHYYVDSVRYRGPWAFWQHADNGQLPGIKGPVDTNIFNGSYDELLRYLIPQ